MRFILTILAASCFVLPASARPRNEGPVDPDIAQWYHSLRQPGTGYGCCDVSDCAPTDLRPSPSNANEWQAFVSKEIFGSDAPDAWVSIPPNKLLQRQSNPTGRVVVCWYLHEIYCAVLPTLF